MRYHDSEETRTRQVMSYPLDIANIHLEFSDGDRSNKFYSATLVTTQNGKAIVIKRWGKIGLIGELKVETYPSQNKAEREYEKIVSAKRGKGYQATKSTMKIVSTETEFRLAIGPAVWLKLPPGPLLHLIPDMDVSGRRELDPNRFDENGKYIGEPPPRVFSKAEIEAARQVEREQEQAEAVKTYASHPKFGRF